MHMAVMTRPHAIPAAVPYNIESMGYYTRMFTRRRKNRMTDEQGARVPYQIKILRQCLAIIRASNNRDIPHQAWYGE